MKLFIKIIIVLIAIIIISQLEYKGRKIQTYIEEYIRSLNTKEEPVVVPEIREENNAQEKVQAQPDQVKKKSTNVDIDDKDRKELQKILEQ
ncbi:MAG TPA: hypothetical protein PK443_06485 [bacterium]|nr:hypothetical protein [bacterium]